MSARLGLIGVGRWGKRYVHTINQISEVRLTHLCTRDPANAGLVSNPVEVSDDWRALLRSRELDGIIIATPPDTHAEILHACLDAGLPAMVEKPLCLSFADALKIKQHVEACAVPVLVDHTHLFQPAWQEIRRHFHPPSQEATAPGRGEIRFIHSEGMAYGPFRKKGISVLWDWAPHDLAMCLDLMQGLPQQIICLGTASGSQSSLDAEMLVLKLNFSSTEAWIHIGHLSMQKRRRFSVFVENETMVFDDLAESKLTEYPAVWGRQIEETQDILKRGRVIDVSRDLPLNLAVVEFAQGIQGQLSERFGVDLAVKVIQILEAAQKSLEDGSRPAKI